MNLERARKEIDHLGEFRVTNAAFV